MPLPVVRRALSCQRGVFAIMGALLLPLLLILLLLVIDYGRGLAARIRWQGIAESAAMAGAAELDGRPEATDRALAAMRTQLRLEEEAAGERLRVPLDYWEWLDRDGRPTRDGPTASGVRIALTAAPVRSFASRLIGVLRPAAGAEATAFTLAPTARAVNDTLVCRATPLAVCLSEEAGAVLTDPTAAGRQMLLRFGAGGLQPICAPGEACTPDQAWARLAQPGGGFCASTMAQSVPLSEDRLRQALTDRFGSPPLWSQSGAHPLITRYPRDLGDSGVGGLGNGYWDRDYYWRISRGQSLPSRLGPATRYQTYLYEIGESFAMRGRETFFPVPPVSVPGRDVIVPLPLQRPFLPLPEEMNPALAPESRVVTVGLADCGGAPAISIRQWLRLFVTEAPDADGLRAEVIGRAVAGGAHIYPQGRLVR